MEDLKDKIIYLQDELIQYLKQINYLERDKKGIESIKNSEIEKLKKEIEKCKAEKMKLGFHKWKNDIYPCDAIGEQLNKTTSLSNDYSSSVDNCCDKEYREKAI